MNYAIHRISLDVTDDSPSQLTIAAKQGDTAKVLIVSLLDDKKNYQISQGSVAVFIAKKSNGVWLEHPCTIDFNANKVIYAFQEDTVSSSGTIECEIHLSKATNVKNEDGSSEVVYEDLTTATFVIAVHDTILSGLTDTTEESTLLPDLITKGTSLFTTLEQVTIPNAESATEEAKTATANAEVATENANTATSDAITATRYAEEEGGRASEEAGKAKVATDNANEAADRANSFVEEMQAKVENGDFNGVSLTHSWSGTKLTVTSASGTSSADLKGDKGAKGDKGDKGDTIATMVELKQDANGYHHTPDYNIFGLEQISYRELIDDHKKRYKINCGSDATATFAIRIPIASVGGSKGYTSTSIVIQLPNGQHRDYCVFEFLNAEIQVATMNPAQYFIKLYYELNGETKEASITAPFNPYEGYLNSSNGYPFLIDSMRLSGVTKAYYYNDNITVEGLRGEKGQDADLDTVLQEVNRKLNDGEFPYISAKELTFYNSIGSVTSVRKPENDSPDWDLELPTESGTLATQEWVSSYAITGSNIQVDSVTASSEFRVGGSYMTYNCIELLDYSNPNGMWDLKISPEQIYVYNEDGHRYIDYPAESGRLLTEEKAEEKYLEKVYPSKTSLYAAGGKSQVMIAIQDSIGKADAGSIPMYHGSTGSTTIPSPRLQTGNPIDPADCINKRFMEWKLLAETEITQAMIDEAGADGVTGVVIDLGEPIEKWYGETWVRIEFGKTSDLNSADYGVKCCFGSTEAQSLSSVDAGPCTIMRSQSGSYAPIYRNQENVINLFTNWHNNYPMGTICQVNGYSSGNYPQYASATSNNESQDSVIGKRYVGFGSYKNEFKFPAGLTMKIYGRF